MLKTRFAAAAAAMLFTTAIVAPASAATITYTYTSTFTGNNNGGNTFTIDATFTGVGDTNDTTTIAGGFPAINLTSFTAQADGPYVISTPFVFGWNSAEGIAGFLNADDSGGFTFGSPGLIGYDGVSNLASIVTTPFFTNTQFQTDRGLITLTAQGAGTFAASVAGGGVPEPATWALMILGMGAVGGAMRRRSAVKTTVRFA